MNASTHEIVATLANGHTLRRRPEITHAPIIASLRLANNGYTLRRNLTAAEREAADAAVAAGVACIKRDLGAQFPKDDRTYYYLPEHKGAAFLP
jgi:hypothetical protein